MNNKIISLAKNLYGKAKNNITTYPQRNADLMNRFASGDPQAMREVIMALPMLTVANKGGSVAKNALALSKKIHPEDLLEMSDFTDYVKKMWSPTNRNYYEGNMRDMANRYNIGGEVNNAALARKFLSVLDAGWQRVEPYLQQKYNQFGGFEVPLKNLGKRG